MKTSTVISVTIGLAASVALVWYYGAGEVTSAVAAAGWGLAAVVLYRFVPLGSDAVGWRWLFCSTVRPQLPEMVRIRWIGESVNTLLPAAQVGGHVVRARLATLLGVPGAEAGATVVVDFTFGIVTQIVYTMIGVVLLVQYGAVRAPASSLIVSAVIAAAVLAGIFLVQHLRPFGRSARIVRALVGRRTWQALVGNADELDRKVPTVYGRRRQLLISFSWRILTRLAHVGETWLALYVLGVDAGFIEAFILDSIITGVRSFAFLIPGALGIQEAGFVVVGGLVGLSPEISLALAVVRRVRELLVGGSGIVAWSHMEGQNLGRLLSARSS